MMAWDLAAPDPRTAHKFFPVIVGICVGALYWLIDVLVDVYVFRAGTVIDQIFHPAFTRCGYVCSPSA